MNIRPASDVDSEAIRDLHMAAFPDSENRLVSRLAVDLLKETTSPPTYGFVAENDEAIIGHVAFSPLYLADTDGWIGYILAPLGIDPRWQNLGTGSRLVKHGVAMLKDRAVDDLFVYGDPAYYSRFGFDVAGAERFRPPFDLEFPSGWQAMQLGQRKFTLYGDRLVCVKPLQDPVLW